MPDFTSALYLGFRHPASALCADTPRPWDALTTGRPAALCEPPLTRGLEAMLARLVGLERALVSSSSLHLFWDLLGQVPDDWTVFIDAEAYPIAQWGAERAAGRGVRVERFPHHDVDALEQLLRQYRGKPLVVTDGFCPTCGRGAPLRAYRDLLQRYGGLLLLDDTQALGIFGRFSPPHPYGRGGGGSLSHAAVAGDDVILIASLAKGFGVPLAVLAGSRRLIGTFKRKGDTRIHCSPPSNAVLTAAHRALSLNRRIGDRLRHKLGFLAGYLRQRLRALGFWVRGGSFPVQSLTALQGGSIVTLYRQLRQRGVRAVLQKGHGATPQLSFLLNVSHTQSDLDSLIETLSELTRGRSPRYFEEVTHVPNPRTRLLGR